MERIVRKYLLASIWLRIILFLLACPFVAATSTFAHAEPLDDARLNNLFASLGFGSYDASFRDHIFEPTTGQVEFRGLALVPKKDSGLLTEYKSEYVVFKGLKVSQSIVAFDSVNLDKIEISPSEPQAAAPLKIDRIEISGAEIPALSSVVADPKRPVSTQVAILRLLSAARASKARVVGLHLEGGLSVREGSMSGLSQGKVASAEIVGYEATAEDGVGSDTAQNIAIQGVDFDPLLKLFEESAYLEAGAARPWRNFFSALSVKGLTLNTGASKISLASAVIGPVRLKQFASSLTSLMDETASESNGDEKKVFDTAMRVQSALREAFAVDKIVLNRIAYETPGKAGKVRSSVAEATVSNFTFRHVDAIDMLDLNLADESASMTMSRLLFGNIELPAIFSDLAEEEASGAIDPSDASEWPRVGRLYFDTLSVDLKEASFKIGRFDLYLRFFIGPIPTNVTATLDNFVINKESLRVPELQTMLTALGYNHLDLSAKISGAWQDSASSLAFDTISLSGKEMGTLSVSGTIAGISRQSFRDPYSAFPAELNAAGLQNFRIAFSNASLYDRAISFLAKENDVSVDQIKKALSVSMPNILGEIKNPAIRNKFIFAFVSFVNNPSVLDLSTSTGDVVPLMEIAEAFADPSRLPGLLKLDASANERKNN
jgi:hypothetical protein